MDRSRSRAPEGWANLCDSPVKEANMMAGAISGPSKRPPSEARVGANLLNRGQWDPNNVTVRNPRGPPSQSSVRNFGLYDVPSETSTRPPTPPPRRQLTPGNAPHLHDRPLGRRIFHRRRISRPPIAVRTRASPPFAPRQPTMSLVNLAHVCSHLQNASKARLGLTSIPVSKMHVKLMLGLQKEGFISSVTLGGTTPPKPFILQTQPSPESLEKMADHLEEQPWDAYPPPEQSSSSSATRAPAPPLGKEEVHETHVTPQPGEAPSMARTQILE